MIMYLQELHEQAPITSFICRTQAGRLHLVDSVGKISLADVTLVEDPSEEDRNDDGEHGQIFL